MGKHLQDSDIHFPRILLHLLPRALSTVLIASSHPGSWFEGPSKHILNHASWRHLSFLARPSPSFVCTSFSFSASHGVFCLVDFLDFVLFGDRVLPSGQGRTGIQNPSFSSSQSFHDECAAPHTQLGLYSYDFLNVDFTERRHWNSVVSGLGGSKKWLDFQTVYGGLRFSSF